MNFARDVARQAGLPSVASADIACDYKRRIGESRTLVSASIELTYRCNRHCTHCDCPTGRRQEELSTDELCRTIDDMAELGCLFRLLSTSTPTGTSRSASWSRTSGTTCASGPWPGGGLLQIGGIS